MEKRFKKKTPVVLRRSVTLCHVHDSQFVQATGQQSLSLGSDLAKSCHAASRMHQRSGRQHIHAAAA